MAQCILMKQTGLKTEKPLEIVKDKVCQWELPTWVYQYYEKNLVIEQTEKGLHIRTDQVDGWPANVCVSGWSNKPIDLKKYRTLRIKLRVENNSYHNKSVNTEIYLAKSGTHEKIRSLYNTGGLGQGQSKNYTAIIDLDDFTEVGDLMIWANSGASGAATNNTFIEKIEFSDGSNVLNVITKINLGINTQFDLKSLAPKIDYKLLTVNNFCIISCPKSTGTTSSHPAADTGKHTPRGELIKSYDNTTGVLTCYFAGGADWHDEPRWHVSNVTQKCPVEVILIK